MERNDYIKLGLILILVLGIITVIVLFFIPNSPIQSALLSFLEWLEEIPKVYSCLLMTIVQTVAVVIILPGTPFNMACGFLFGVFLGSVVSVISTDAAAVISFFIARYLARDWAEEQMAKRPKFKALDKAVDKHGWYIIFLIRVSPVFPFGVCNYFFGLTQVGFWKYWLSSTVGLAPYTIAYTYLGSLMRDLADMFSDNADDSGESPTDSWIWIGVGAGTTVLTVIVIAFVTRRALQKAMIEVEAEEAAEQEAARKKAHTLEDEENEEDARNRVDIENGKLGSLQNGETTAGEESEADKERKRKLPREDSPLFDKKKSRGVTHTVSRLFFWRKKKSRIRRI